MATIARVRAAIVTFDGLNEVDSFVPLHLLSHPAALGWKAEPVSAGAPVTSMNAVTAEAQRPLEFANDADIVLSGSGLYTRAIPEDKGRTGSLLDRLHLDPVRQTIGARGSGSVPARPPRPPLLTCPRAATRRHGRG